MDPTAEEWPGPEQDLRHCQAQVEAEVWKLAQARMEVVKLLQRLAKIEEKLWLKWGLALSLGTTVLPLVLWLVPTTPTRIIVLALSMGIVSAVLLEDLVLSRQVRLLRTEREAPKPKQISHPRFSTLTARRLLMLFPPQFREQYSELILLEFEEQYRDACESRGRWFPARVWLKNVAALIYGAAAEWRRVLMGARERIK